MPIFDSGYPTNSSPADDDYFLTTDTSDGKAVKRVTFAALKNYLIAATKWITSTMIGDGQIPILRSTTYYTASTTWTKPSTMTANGYIIVTVVGGGGGGGGAGTNDSRGGGGGGGAYSRKRIDASALGATEAITVGAAGTAGASGNNAGGAGGDSKFGTTPFLTAGGGLGGQPGNGSFVGTTGGVATGGDLNINGGNGTARRSGSSLTFGMGIGGSSPMGFGFPNLASLWFYSEGSGADALGYGGGGNGGLRVTGSVAGGAGTQGIVIVEVYS